MRPVLHGDISSVARFLLSVPPDHRERMCWQVICEAEDADAFLRKTGRLHPVLGNGSLMSAAHKRPLPPEPRFDDVGYCECFRLVLDSLITFHLRGTRT